MKENAPLYKKFSLGILIWTILATSINNGIVCFNATILYRQAQFPWYEWVNYIFLTLFLFIIPIACLFFLDSVYVRRFLRFFLFIMFLNKFSKFSDLLLGPFMHFDTMLNYDRGFTSLYFFFEFLTQALCFLFILRQIRGKSLLPIAVNTHRKGPHFLRNLKSFILTPEKKNKKKVNATIVLGTVILMGIFFTLPVENKTITLARPQGHQMKIKFWGGSNGVSNETLQLLANNNVEIYGWLDENEIEVLSQFEIPCYGYRGIPTEPEDDRDAYFNELSAYLDYIDAFKENKTKYFQGFVSDFEGFSSIAQVNETYYQDVIEYHSEIIEYVRSRGYEYSIVETMHSIGDLYDGDSDVDLVYMNPFHPNYYENATAINWMVYRMEKAMPYDEPYEYFTYQWASHINRYMKYLENEYEYPEGYWQNKSGMSIGVTSDYFYTYNSDVRGFETSLNEYLQDVKICHACKIGEISGFSLRSFIDNWGIEGLERLLEDLNSYETVSFEYKRRATYFGNLRWGVNINGSVFGLFYSDGFYSNWFNMLSLISLIGLGIIVLASMIKKYPDTSFYGKMGKSRKREKNGKKREKMTPEGEKREEIKENKKSKSTYLRIFFFIMWGLVLFWAFGMGKIFFYPPQAVGWLDFYWEEVALDDEQFFAFWTYFTENIAHYLIAAIIIIPILAYTLVRYFDKKK